MNDSSSAPPAPERNGDFRPRIASGPSRILIVEDRREEAKYIGKTLEMLEYDVVAEVSTGEEALHVIEELEVDLVLMDIRLPGPMDGIEAAHRIVTGANVPVIFVTAYADDATVTRAKKTLAAGYLVKPYDKGELKATIELALQRHQKQWKDREMREELHRLLEDSLAHELSNWLGAAETAAQLLLSSTDIERRQRTRLAALILDSIRGGKQAAQDLAGLLEPLSEKSKMRRASLPLTVREVIRLCQSQAIEGDVSISIRDEVPDVRVPASPVRLALANVVSNAVKHHRKKGGDRWVRVSASSEAAGKVTIAVEDNGPGIPAEDADNVFAYGFRANLDTEGSGLGLTIAREAIEKVGGSVALGSGTEGGALFTITVPVIGEENR